MPNNPDNICQHLLLQRYPIRSQDKLLAWDAADEYLLQTLLQNASLSATDNVLVFNDTFGAICVGIHSLLQTQSITVITDSINAEKGILANLNKHPSSKPFPHVINSLEQHKRVYHWILIKAPKSLDYLLFFLNSIITHVSADCRIMIAGMVKHLPKNLWLSLEKNFGPTRTSLTHKKAKIINLSISQPAQPSTYPTTYQYKGYTLFNHAGVFSKNSLDYGTQFLLENFPQLDGIRAMIDLACGNGIIGLNLAKLYPQATLTLIDESYMAIASAQLTLRNNLHTTDTIQFKVNNCLDGFEPNSVDLIVCNPPFHQAHQVGIHIALTMFTQAHRTLRKNGHLLVVANRHLPYYSHLLRLFKTVNTLASNQKFNLFLLKK